MQDASLYHLTHRYCRRYRDQVLELLQDRFLQAYAHLLSHQKTIPIENFAGPSEGSSNVGSVLDEMSVG